MLDDRTLQAIAHAYHQAEKERRRVRPPSAQYPGFTIEDGYEVQRRGIALKLAEGRSVRGRKIGLTSRAMQSMSGITEPDYGVLLDDMFFADGADLPFGRFIEPRLECELAFIMGRRLAGPNCTIFEVLNAADYVVPAVEIVDLRTLNVDPETKAQRKVQDNVQAYLAQLLQKSPVAVNEIGLRKIFEAHQ